MIEISEVTTAAERAEFIRFPWRIYTHDPAWVPPLILERKEFLNPQKHPFYKHGAAALFLARRGGELVGRIMASDDPHYNALHQSNIGCFGLFESINDSAVAHALFDRAAAWLRARGRSEIMGPIDYSTNYTCGLLVEGFQHPPTLLNSHNPPYYPPLIESDGFTKAMDLYAWWLADPARAVQRLRRFASALKNRQLPTIRPANLQQVGAESRRLREIYNEAWENNWGYVPFTPEEFAYMTKELKPLVTPELVLIAEINGEAAGFLLCVPDLNQALRHVPHGRLTTFGLPIGLLKLLYHKRRVNRVRLVALGVVPKFRRSGVAEMLVLRIIEFAMLQKGYAGEASLVLENNHLMNRFMAAIGADRYKTYRIYRRALG
ncbi:GNAT family N-acetyltransferase [soil metagenome]